MRIIVDASERAFEELTELARLYPSSAGRGLEGLMEAGRLVHTTAGISIGAMPGGMASGEPAVALCLKLPGGKVVLAETSLRLFYTAADAFKARYGDPRMADLSMPDITLPPDFPPQAMVLAAITMAEKACDSVSGEAFDGLSASIEQLRAVLAADGMPDEPEAGQC